MFGIDRFATLGLLSSLLRLLVRDLWRVPSSRVLPRGAHHPSNEIQRKMSALSVTDVPEEISASAKLKQHDT